MFNTQVGSVYPKMSEIFFSCYVNWTISVFDLRLSKKCGKNVITDLTSNDVQDSCRATGNNP